MGLTRLNPKLACFFKLIDYDQLIEFNAYGPRVDDGEWHPYFSSMDAIACPWWVIAIDWVRGMWLKAAHPYWNTMMLFHVYEKRLAQRWWMWNRCTDKAVVYDLANWVSRWDQVGSPRGPRAGPQRPQRNRLFSLPRGAP